MWITRNQQYLYKSPCLVFISHRLIVFSSYFRHILLPNFIHGIFTILDLCYISLDSISAHLLIPCVFLFLLLGSSQIPTESPESYLFFMVSVATLNPYLVLPTELNLPGFTYWTWLNSSWLHIYSFFFLLTVPRSPCKLYLSHRTMSSPSCICLLTAIDNLVLMLGKMKCGLKSQTLNYQL